MAGSLFAPRDGGLVPAVVARGPWDAGMMHGGAPAALLARAVQAVEPAEDMMVARMTVEFLGGVALEPVSVAASVVRPGRRFQVVEATLDADGRRACVARAVRLRRGDLPEAPGAGPDAPRLPAPEDCEDLPPFAGLGAEMFHPDAMEIRRAGGELGSGAFAAWLRLRGDLLPGEAPPTLARVAAAADFANGLSWVLPFDRYVFVNTELTIHLHREPEGEWIGLDCATVVDQAGIGLATGTLHDRGGPIGVCAQSLYVAAK